jgi:hypothetical protein
MLGKKIAVTMSTGQAGAHITITSHIVAGFSGIVEQQCRLRFGCGEVGRSSSSRGCGACLNDHVIFLDERVSLQIFPVPYEYRKTLL